MKFLSATKLGGLFRCAYQFKRIHIDKQPKPPGIVLLVGRSVDETVDENMVYKMKNGILLPQDQIEDVARDRLNEEWEKEGVLLTEEEKKEGEKKIRGQCVDKSVRLARLHHQKVAPIIKPKKVQRKWKLEITGFPYDITGRIDIQEDDSIRDTKTTKSKKTGAADKSLQLTLYALAGKKIDGKDYKLFLDFLVDNKTPKEDIQSTQRTQKDFNALFRKLEIAAKILESGIFPPANREASYTCSPMYCGYWDECPYV